MKRLVQRGLVLLGASAISMGLVSPAFANTQRGIPSSAVVQDQAASVSNQTEQRSAAFAPAIQVAPALNLGVLNFGGQSIDQANQNSSNAQAVNANATQQSVAQSQEAKAGPSGRSDGRKHAKHHGRVDCKHHKKHHGKVDRKHHKKHHRNHHARHVHKRHAKHPGKRHVVKPSPWVSQRQSADESNSTNQQAIAKAPAIQVAPAVNVGLLDFGGQSIHQANRNSSHALAGNFNATDQEVGQSQRGDA